MVGNLRSAFCGHHVHVAKIVSSSYDKAYKVIAATQRSRIEVKVSLSISGDHVGKIDNGRR